MREQTSFTNDALTKVEAVEETKEKKKAIFNQTVTNFHTHKLLDEDDVIAESNLSRKKKKGGSAGDHLSE